MVDFVVVDVLEIAYERVGAGPPLVLVHGSAAGGRTWRPQLDALGEGPTVVAWDERGAGRSADAPGDFGLHDYANCLTAMIEQLALGPVHAARASFRRRFRTLS